MKPNACLLGLLAVLALAPGCREAASPGTLTLAIAPTSRLLGVHQDSVTSVLVDSAVVALAGAGATTARWSATHGAAPWLTLVAAAGAGPAALRWVVDPTDLPPGTYVDTVTVAVTGGERASLHDTLVVRGTPAALITMTRAWLPGEQVATIAAAEANHTALPYVGDLSTLASQLYAGDSVTEVVANPASVPVRAGAARAVQFSAGWSAVGVELSIQDRSSTPWDTLSWLGVMWWNPADSTWKGWTIAATRANTVRLTTVSTSVFDASGATSGAGGGEARSANGTYWEANAGQIQISKNNGCSRVTTITSGVWLGGTVRTCKFGGRLVNLTMPRVTGTTSPATQTINFDFRTARITGTRIVCVFPTPCTGAAVVAAIRRARALKHPARARS
jgi:hypothetical protein